MVVVSYSTGIYPWTRNRNKPYRPYYGSEPLWLLTPGELDQLPDGITLTSIHGKTVVTGRNHLGLDTRMGVTAYGILESQIKPIVEIRKGPV